MSQRSCSYPWIPDRGDGSYRNPILHADYSDPDVVRVGDDFYLIASSFNCIPGLPILHSKDLVNWTLVNHALRELPDPRYRQVQHGQGVWAPSIRHHDGRFWIIFPTPDEGLYVTTATDPLGEWSEPHLLLGGSGLIDPCPLWDDDGQAYIVYAYAASRCGIRNKLHIRPMSPDGKKVLDEGKVVIEIDPELPALEGPKFLKRNGWYYILAPGGGVATGWQTVFRSRDIYGPYEKKVVLAQRGTEVNGPHQGGLIDTPSDDWWFLHFQEKQPYGRIVHLQPVRWEDDWPLMGEDQDENGVGRPVSEYRKPLSTDAPPVIPDDSDDFSGQHLGLQWQWHANSRDGWYSLSEKPGCLRLNPAYVEEADLSRAPNLLLQKFSAASFSAATRLELSPGDGHLHAGLVVMGREFAALDVRRVDGAYQVRLLSPGENVSEETVSGDSGITLKVLVSDGGSCRFGIVRADGLFHQLGPAFQAVPGVWIGAKVGLFCVTDDQEDLTGHADFDWFEIDSLAAPGERGLYVLESRESRDKLVEESPTSSLRKAGGTRSNKGSC